MEDLIRDWGDAIIDFAPRLVLAAVVFLAFWIASKVLRRAVRTSLARLGAERQEVVGLLANATHIIVLIIGAISSLGTVGVDVSALVAGLGLAGFAIGFALRDAVSNTLAGVLVLMYQPFRVGDDIKTGGVAGKVISIDLRYTTIEGDAERYLVPNGTLLKGPVTVHDGAAGT